MATYASIKYDMNLASTATGTGGMTLLSTQTASSSATISFTSGINSTYKEYQFHFTDIHPATDGESFQFNMSADGGSNYNVTKTTTYLTAYNYESGGSPALTYATNVDLAQSTAFQNVNSGVGSDNDQSVAGILQLFDPSSTTFVKHFISRGNTAEASNISSNVLVGGYGNTTSAVDAVQFKFSSGNIDAGTIKMYGVS